ncbi:MAG TPA: tetraacyldisaccharide 4'-kinase [Burkholderiales bacterium]|nr:tetraacyldisaccharide 4'-kinase [Burkholderiales bacterium]
MHRLERQWRTVTLWHLLLLPLSWLYAAASSARRSFYRLHLLPVEYLPVPVLVIGNITVGGTGKTPLVIWLARQLLDLGWRPGIISRGYGGSADTVRHVAADSDPAEVGDEPLLLARNLPCPVWVGRNRPAAGKALLAAYPDTNIILSDDGLQHLALGRNLEIAVVDAARGTGNGFLLPAGPLREPVSRLNRVDAVVVNHAGNLPPELPEKSGLYLMHFAGSIFRNLKFPEKQASAADFRGKTLHAIAGIGHPQRFFDQLATLGLLCIPHAFPDHHKYLARELNFPGILIMTEKDAVKCEAIATEQMWVLPIRAELDPGLMPHLLAKLGNRHG